MRCMLQMMTPSIEPSGTEPGGAIRVYEAGPVRYTEAAPPQELASAVECYWTLRVDSTADDGYRHHMLPDLTIDLISVNGGRAFVMGPPTSPHRVPLAPGLYVEGARLHAAAARHVLDCAPADLLDTKADIDDVLRAPRDFADQLSQRSLRELVPELLRRNAAAGDSADSIVRSAIAWLGANSQSSIDDLSRQVSWSDRKLRRRFVDAVGMGPKLVQRIVRVQRALHQLRGRAGRISLSGLAVDCGFADQAHMTREVAHFTGLTPSRLRSLAHPSELAAPDYA